MSHEEKEQQLTAAVRDLGKRIEHILGIEYAGALVLATTQGLWILSPEDNTDTLQLIRIAYETLQRECEYKSN